VAIARVHCRAAALDFMAGNIIRSASAERLANTVFLTGKRQCSSVEVL
jgi:hypothetical protein